MLDSCDPDVRVVKVDIGFGCGYVAGSMNWVVGEKSSYEDYWTFLESLSCYIGNNKDKQDNDRGNQSDDPR